MSAVVRDSDHAECYSKLVCTRGLHGPWSGRELIQTERAGPKLYRAGPGRAEVFEPAHANT